MPYHGEHLQQVRDARAMQQRLAEERRVNGLLLEEAIAEREMNALTSVH